MIITGPSGTGKSRIACALAHKACLEGFQVRYLRVPRLLTELRIAHGEGRFPRLFRQLVRAELLILDDWGPERLTSRQRRDLMGIVEDRCDSSSMGEALARPGSISTFAEGRDSIRPAWTARQPACRARASESSGEGRATGGRPTMNAQARRRETDRATYRDVLDAPPRMVAEVIAGTLHTHPRPAMRHAWASSGLGMKIGPPFSHGDDGPGGWWIIDEPELHLGEDIVVPDLAGWRRETMPEYPDAAYCTIAPDWACEVLSPSTRRLDQGEKRDLYAREGVRHLWFVDPDARTLEAFELRDGRWLLLATLVGNASVSLPPFDAIAFPLGALWPDAIAGTGNADAGEGS